MILLPHTAGFFPLHVFWGPEFDRAQQIVASINSMAMESMGLGDAETQILHDLSLREMLDAVETVKQWNRMPKQNGITREHYVVPDARLTAAAYTLLHYFDRNADKDDDHIPVRFSFRHWGEDKVHFLLVGNRLKSDADDDEAEEAA